MKEIWATVTQPYVTKKGHWISHLAVLTAASIGFAATDNTVVVHVGTTEEPVVEFAASEFVKYATRLTGEDVVFAKDAASHTATTVVVVTTVDGNTMPALKTLCEGHWADVPPHEEGFLVRTVTAQDQVHLLLIGRTPRAAVYAVYHYLEKYCRVGFFKDYVEYVPEGTGLRLDGVNEASAPAFNQRSLGTRHPWFQPDDDRSRHRIRIDWHYKMKSNALSGIANEDEQRQRGGQGRGIHNRPMPFPVGGAYPLSTLELYPKGLLGDGFSNWRGSKYYAHGTAVDEPQDMTAVTRLLYHDRIKSGAKKDGPHMYYFNVAVESDESGYYALDTMDAAWTLLREFDPQARFYLEVYGSPKFQMFQKPYDIFVMGNVTSDAHLPRSRRNGSSYYANRGFFGHPWFYLIILAGGDDLAPFLPGIQQLIPAMRELAAMPSMTCAGTGIFADARSHWLLEDLYAQLTWDPRAITFEGWVRDLSERRFGKDSAPTMSVSVREYVQIMDQCRYFGYNNYVYDLIAVHKADDPCWFKTVRRDWWGYVDGQRNFLRMQRSLLVALHESPNQVGNSAYDQYVVELYRFLAAEAFKFPLIKLHHHYFRATEAFRLGNVDAAAPHVERFETAAAGCGLVLQTLADVLSTQDQYRMKDLSGRHELTSKRKGDYLRWQNCRQDVFELVGGLYRPRFAVMVEAMRQRMARGATEIIDSKMIHPWYPGPDPYYYYPTAKDPATLARQRQVVEDFVNKPLNLKTFEGSTATAAQSGLRTLERAGLLYHEGMETNERIAERFPLSDPPRLPAGYHPIQKTGPHTYLLEPLYTGHQIPYNGPAVDDWFDIEDTFKLSFQYRSTGPDRVSPDNSIRLELNLDGTIAHTWNFDPTRREPVKAGCSLDGHILNVHHGSRTISKPLSRAPTFGALRIVSHDTNRGSRPQIELHDLQCNEQPVTLYDDVWHEPPTVEEVRALRAELAGGGSSGRPF